MDRSYRAWYLLAALLALVPAGVRLYLWHKARPQALDPGMAKAGEALFKHEWHPGDPLSPAGDGLGPVFNASSCLACHHQGGPGGAGGLEHNVTAFTVRDPKTGAPAREGVVHSFALAGFQETLRDVHPSLPPIAHPTLDQLLPNSPTHCVRTRQFPPGVHLSQRNTPALFGAKLIDDLPERVIIAAEKSERLKWTMAPADGEDAPVGRALRLANGRVGRFGWKDQTASLADFVPAACANELGLGNPGQAQPRPLGKPAYQPCGLDLTTEQCDQLTAFVGSLPRPAERLPEDGTLRDAAAAGKKLFGSLGCADCHTPNLGSVEGIYSDLLLHPMGQDLVGGGSYGEPPAPVPDLPPGGDGPSPGEWRTPPLWGVADSAPYLHDGRAATLEDAIRMHGGQGERAARRFKELDTAEQGQLIAFLKTLRAP
jgi:CxxC motif-containing protein (DUF1111 family)